MNVEHYISAHDTLGDPGVIAAALDNLAGAVRAIAHGDVSGPAGLEALTMALTGPGGEEGNLARAISDAGISVKEGLESIAEAIREGHGS